MSVTAKVETADLRGAQRKAAPISEAARAAVTMAAMRDTNQFVPYRPGSGALRGTAELESKPEKGELVYGNGDVVYARPQYYGCPNKTWPGTVMKWFEHAKPIYMSSWLDEGERAAKEAAGR